MTSIASDTLLSSELLQTHQNCRGALAVHAPHTRPLLPLLTPLPPLIWYSSQAEPCEVADAYNFLPYKNGIFMRFPRNEILSYTWACLQLHFQPRWAEMPEDQAEGTRGKAEAGFSCGCSSPWMCAGSALTSLLSLNLISGSLLKASILIISFNCFEELLCFQLSINEIRTVWYNFLL